MTRAIAGSIRSRSFGILFLLVAIGVGALLVTASGPDAKPDGAPPPLVGGKVAFVGSPLYVTAAAHVSGAVGTDWRTDLEVYNSGSVQATYEIALLEKNRANPNPITVQFSLNPGMSVRYNDILMSVFGYTGSASLRITVIVGEVTVSSRTYNQVTGGTYGQFIGGEPESRAVHHGQEARIIQLTHNVSTTLGFRTNVGFLNCTGGTIVVQVDLYKWDGSFLGSRSYSLEAYMFKQIDRIFRQVTQDDVSDGYVVIRTTTPGGKFFAYASVVDNRTGDPIYIPAVIVDGGGGPPPTATPTQTGTRPPNTATFTPTRTYTPTYTPTATQGGANVNLAPFTPSGWQAPVVASGTEGTHTSGGLVGGQPTYVDWALINDGPGDVTFEIGVPIALISLDGAGVVQFVPQTAAFELPAGFYTWWDDWQIDDISAGQHTIRLTGDPSGMIPESNEGDNIYDFVGTWSGAKQGGGEPPVVSVSVDHLRIAPIPGYRGPSNTKVAVSEPVYIAASAHVAGAVGTNWRTDLELHNPGTSQGQYEIALLLKNQANPNPQTAVYTVGPGRCVRLNDVLLSVFGFEGGASLRVRTLSGDVIVTSRTYNQTSEGTYGQFIGGAPESEAIDHGEEGVIIQLSQQQAKSTGFRANLGFVSAVGTTLVVQADMYRSDGTFLGSRTWNLQSWMHRQQDRIFQQVTGNDLADGYIIVKTLTPGGRFFAYASVVDNATGDPVYIPATVLGGGGVPPTPTPTGTGVPPTPTPTFTGVPPTPTPTGTSVPPTPTPSPTPIDAPPFDPQDLGQQIIDWIAEFPTTGGRNLEEAVADFQAEGLGPLLQEIANSTPGIANATSNSLNVNYGSGYVLDDGTVATGQFNVDFSNIVNTSTEVGFNVNYSSTNLTIDGEAPQIDQATGSTTLSVSAGGQAQGGASFNGTGQAPMGKSTTVVTGTGNVDIDTALCLHYPTGGSASLDTDTGTHTFEFAPTCDGTFIYVGPGGTGDLAFRLVWSNNVDLDLHVIEPSGEEIYFGNSQSATGGELDHDCICDCPQTVENIFWPTGQAPHGHYQYWTHFWGNCGSGPTTVSGTMHVLVSGVVVHSEPFTVSEDQETTRFSYDF